MMEEMFNDYRVAETLGWRPEHSGVKEIIESAWSWHLCHPDGYRTCVSPASDGVALLEGC